MALADFRDDMMSCVRCSSCKWVPFNQMKSKRFAKNCPSICRHNFHSYSGSGRVNMGLSLLEERSRLTETVSEVIYSCQMCGACDTHCKVYREVIDINDVLLELRAKCVEDGQLVLEHMAVMDALKRENNMLGEPKAKRGDWAEGLGLKDINSEKADVMFHAGCRFSYDRELWDAARGAVRLLQAAGLEVGIAGAEESCCGGRAFELGYRGEARNFFEDMLARVKSSGASMLVTPCADGYAAFKYLYPMAGVELPVEVLHVSQVQERMIESGKLRPRRPVELKVTWHDPCHLGRMGEPFLGGWTGDKRDRLRSQSRTGKRGVYDAPREILRSIPGVELVEMERIKQYSWCCGAGGGVIDAYPEYAIWTAIERLEEAASTGAEALVTACPWCERMFTDAIEEAGSPMRVLDLSELMLESCLPSDEEVVR
ncbi:MAG: (Fe-S)-binding protein [Candidatus Geothermincolia bacterium]